MKMSTNHLKDDTLFFFSAGSEHHSLVGCYKVHCVQNLCER